MELIKADITTIEVEAVVNAANTSLRGGAGVDGAIHSAAGPELLRELKRRFPNGIKTGEAVITRAYRLPCKYIIHTAGPIYNKSQDSAKLLRMCIRNSLRLAEGHGCESIAFSAISTGVYGYPYDEFARIAIEELNNDMIKRTILVVFNDELYKIISRIIREQKKLQQA